MTGCAKTENAPAAESSVEAVSEASSEAAEETTTEAAEETSTAAAEEASKSEGVLNYEEYMAAELDSEVVVETYVQAKQSWWEDKATVYTQDQDGAYFVYNMACSEEDYENWYPEPKSKLPDISLNGPVKWKSLMPPLKSWKVIPTSLPSRMLPQCSEPMN